MVPKLLPKTNTKICKKKLFSHTGSPRKTRDSKGYFTLEPVDWEGRLLSRSLTFSVSMNSL